MNLYLFEIDLFYAKIHLKQYKSLNHQLKIVFGCESLNFTKKEGKKYLEIE